MRPASLGVEISVPENATLGTPLPTANVAGGVAPSEEMGTGCRKSCRGHPACAGSSWQLSAINRTRAMQRAACERAVRRRAREKGREPVAAAWSCRSKPSRVRVLHSRPASHTGQGTSGLDVRAGQGAARGRERRPGAGEAVQAASRSRLGGFGRVLRHHNWQGTVCVCTNADGVGARTGRTSPSSLAGGNTKAGPQP